MLIRARKGVTTPICGFTDQEIYGGFILNLRQHIIYQHYIMGNGDSLEMDKFQIAETAGEHAHAGTKATQDVVAIAQKCDFKPLYIRREDLKPGFFHMINRQIHFCVDWAKAYQAITEGSTVLLQHPFRYKQLTREKKLLRLKNEKHVKFISVVHDVEELRTLENSKYHRHEFEFMIQIADVLIVHNNAMREFFVNRGFDKEKIVVLEIFDYLRDAIDSNLPIFERSITIAGNLDAKKSAYIEELPKIDCIFHLYGPGFSLENAKNVTYGGVLPPNQIPEVLTKGFGLVWDGESAAVCKGGYGDYLRYNNPHKLSLYLSSGLPVIIWKEAAEASFVEENSVGYTVDSLFDVPKLMETISQDEYRRIAENTKLLAMRLVGGEYMQSALNEAIKLTNNGR